MPWWADILDVLGLLAVLVVACFLFLFGRRRWLSRGGATFECSLRMKPPRTEIGRSTGRGWTLGLARYSGSSLQWFRVFSFSTRPKRVFERTMQVRDRRTPQGSEAFALFSGNLVVSVLLDTGETIEMAMGERALTSFLAWIEAAPPGPRQLPPYDPGR